jgi:chloramphenicol O-acetyltransferase type B
MSKYELVDMKKWKRTMHCEVFRNSVQPQYCVSLELDITHFYKIVKEKKYSFTLAFIYAVAKCANEIEEFRYRFQDGNVVLYDRINTSFTFLNKETELFKVVNADMKDSMEEYISVASETEQNQSAYFTGPLGNDVFQFSALPWISFTHISHTDSGKKENATPLFDWGKFFERDGKLILPFSIQVHHSFVDGIHIGKLIENLQKYLNEI